MDKEDWAFAAVIAATFAAAAVAFAAPNENDWKKSLCYSGISLILSGISFAITFGLNINFSILFSWQVGVLLLIIMEILFLSEKNKPKKNENKELFAWKRKGINTLKAIGILFGLDLIYNLVLVVKDYWNEIINWTGYIGAGLIVLVILYFIVRGYGKLNAMKYKENGK